MKLAKIILVSSLAGLVAGCAANAPENGICQRQCGARPIGGGNLIVQKVGGAELKYSGCPAGASTTTEVDTVEFNFLVLEDKSDQKPGGDSGASGDTATDDEVVSGRASKIPKAGIAFRPMIFGRVIDKDEDNAGTATAASEWCTDSCGYARVVVRPVCMKQTMNIDIAVPGAFSGENGGASGGFSVEIE
jgi:hypothetical protein